MTLKENSEEKVLLDVACGQRKQPGYIGVDISGEPDILHNLFEFPYSFAEDNSVDEIYTSHFLEHIPMTYWNEGNEYSIVQKDGESRELFEKMMDEFYRILKPNGKITIICPYYNNMRCWQDPTHRRAITEATFLYFNKEWRDSNGLSHCHGTCNFNYSYGYNIQSPWNSRNPEMQGFAIKHYTNIADDIIVTLTPIK